MAKVTDPFIAAVKACTWQSAGGGSLLSADGRTLYPCAAPSTGHDVDWTLAPAGANTYTIDDYVYGVLCAAKGTSGAHYDGEFVDANDVSHWLGGKYGVAGNSVAVLPDGPPPPPPP